MKTLPRFAFQALALLLLSAAVLFISSCGPEQDAIENRDEEIRAINKKEALRLQPVEGYYLGTMVAYGGGKAIQISLDVKIYSVLREGGRLGGENSIPMLQASLVKLAERTADGRMTHPIALFQFLESNYSSTTGKLTFSNGKQGGSGIEAVFTRLASGEYTIEGSLFSQAALSSTRFSVKKVLE